MISLLGTTVTIKKAVDWTDLYDLASVTKITATLPGVMNWYEKQPLLLESTVGQQLPELATSDKGNLVLEDVLAHQSGLPAWIPYYLRTIDNDSAKAFWYVSSNTPGSIKVTEELYLRRKFAIPCMPCWSKVNSRATTTAIQIWAITCFSAC